MWFLNSKKYIGKQYGRYTINGAVGTPVIIKRFKPNIFKKNKEKNVYEAIILSQLNHYAIPKLLGVINEKGFYGR